MYSGKGAGNLDFNVFSLKFFHFKTFYAAQITFVGCVQSLAA
jgi:hypothetical protein